MHELTGAWNVTPKNVVQAARGNHHESGSASLGLAIRHRHHRTMSRDWASWRQHVSGVDDVSPPPDFEPAEEIEDEDLRAYRLGDQPVTAITDALTETAEAISPRSPTIDTQEDTWRPSSEMDDPSEASTDGEDKTAPQAERVARSVLDQEFRLRLGLSSPPQDIVEAVRACLDEISLSLGHARCMGVLAAHGASDAPGSVVPFTPAAPRNKSSGSTRKRTMRDQYEDDDDMQEEGDEGDGNDLSGYSDAGHRKKPKLEQYPCPFRKRNPHKFNCREWEYCAKAPFKSMTELKKHILKYHQQQQFTYKCIRCHVGFARIAELQAHMRVDVASMCAVRPGPPPALEDEQVTAAVGAQLRSRAEHYDWVRLWQALFPNDSTVPDPEFEPIVELHEVDHEFRSALPQFQLQLQSTLDYLLRGWSPPPGPPGSRNDAAQLRHVLDGTLENLFKDLVATTFQKSRDHVVTATRETSPESVTSSSSAVRRNTSNSTRTTTGSLRPSSSITSSTSSPRPILPSPNRNSVWSSTSAGSSNSAVASPAATTPSSSARYSTGGRSYYRDSFTAESQCSSTPPPSFSVPQPVADNGPPMMMRELVLRRHHRASQQGGGLPPVVVIQKNQRDSAITDVDCPKCFNAFLNLGPCRCEEEGGAESVDKEDYYAAGLLEGRSRQDDDDCSADLMASWAVSQQYVDDMGN
ncbi:hypothetical protein B0H66DRAFT_469925 [Apodospora peruviana]|uniref:C2H2-type domain-containing protein n=1 Tax=Apodospora peruviana TaxID=516989 RepID=A0AAE0IUK1_9PEZI|nr:hypothetical protein B0H66DRAFT_469925 [Apodospora peruviana]